MSKRKISKYIRSGYISFASKISFDISLDRLRENWEELIKIYRIEKSV